MPPSKAVKRVAKKRPATRVASRPNIAPVRQLGLQYAAAGIYAWPGAGKTPFLGSGGEGTLILDADFTGLTSAADSDADGFILRDYDDLEEVYQWLRHAGHKEYDWAWIDSLTLFQDGTLIDDILAEAVAHNSNMNPDVPSQKEYLISQNRIGKYVRRFIQLPMHVGFTFHVTAYERPGGDVIYVPLMQGGKNNEFSTKIQGYLNVLGYLYVKEEKGERTRYVRFAENEEYMAKDKFGVLPGVMKDPTLANITKRIEKRMAELDKEAKKKNGKS